LRIMRRAYTLPKEIWKSLTEKKLTGKMRELEGKNSEQHS
jgi:hypothetical protein